tara:strand:+ start:431 stop:565 length:135 start_codon:yes stop_codon:yes gene_type:complete
MKKTYHFKLDASAPEIKITYKQRAVTIGVNSDLIPSKEFIKNAI